MKHNLGKYLTLMLVFTMTLLFAEDFSYSMKADKTDPFVKEAVLLSFDFNQTNPNIVLLLHFDINPSKDYTFQRVDVRESDSYHNIKVHYAYIFYPLKPGKINVTFNLVQKITNDESVAYSYSGGRDNIKTLVTKDSHITLPPLKLNVQELPMGTKVVGDFTLTSHVEKHKAKAYEPLPLQIILKGEGYPPLLKNMLPSDLNVTVFKEKPIIKSQHSIHGSNHTITYPMALSHDKSFTLPLISLKAFNPKKESTYTLTIPQQHFDITKEDASVLIDKVDNPKAYSTDWGWLKTLLSYLIVFTAGYLTAISLKWRKRIIAKPENKLVIKIRESKNAKSLLQLLMATDSKKFNVMIENLENGLYKNAKMNLNKIKQHAIEEAE